MIWEARAWPLGARLLPWTLGVPVLALALVQLVLAFRARRSTVASRPDGEGSLPAEPPAPPAGGGLVRFLKIAGLVPAFALGIGLFGFRLGAAVLTFTFLKALAGESWRMTLALTATTYLAFLLAFSIGLNLTFPAGALATTLGTDAFDAFVVDAVRSLLFRR